MDNIADKILEIYVRRGVDLKIAIKIFESENNIKIKENEVYNYLIKSISYT